MRKLVIFSILIIQLVSCVSTKKHNQQIETLHTPESLYKDIDKVYSQLKKHHPNLYQYTSKKDLDFKFDSLKKSIKTPINSREFYKKLAPVVAQVKQGHVSLGSAYKEFTRKERKELKKKEFEFYNLDFEYLNNKLWVVKTRGKDSSMIGAEVLKIDNEKASVLVETFKTRFASDGYNQTLQNRLVGRSFSTFYYKDKGFLDSLNIQFKLKDSVFSKTLKRISKKKKTKENDSVEQKTPIKLTKLERKQNKIAAKNKRKKDKKFGFIAKRKEYTRNFNFIGKDSTTAYMKIRGFNNGTYRKFYKESFKKLDSAKTKNLILDLRDNGGGRIEEINYLYGYLSKTKYTFMAPSKVNSRLSFFPAFMNNTSGVPQKIFAGIISPFLALDNLLKTKKKDGELYYRFPYSKEKSPKKINYIGNLYVLINGNSFSASSLISTNLQATKRAVFVGEETGGAYNGCVAGLYKIYRLPESKLKIRMGLMQIEAPFKQNPDGYGIKPNVEIAPTISSRLSGKDPELDWILDNISKK
ncbi:S41 family peptidase [Algibacter sp. L4_22]|uniref:S41 family peptidase n=1 Tax=Algibacter sp. L4_22 TaxID=2942477 RepID=UPI00201B97FD|nr:S41 family peptidase [Algibacter sp. L4_22]MCL5128092.1 S41 family peptidase [Algibacter sp. L4_22]